MKKKKTVLPDYKNCISGLPNSVMKYFGATPPGGTLPLIDGLLRKEYKNVVVILLDGMGVGVIEDNLREKGFCRSHLRGSCSSTFPPTTVAATTSVLSGLLPSTHSWLGWDCYYPQIDKNVTVFRNTEQGTKTPAADFNVAGTFTGYESVIDRLRDAGIGAHTVAPFLSPFKSFRDELSHVEELCRKDGRKYVYAYWPEPDTAMHFSGCRSRRARRELRTLERQVRRFCKRVNDTLVIVTADHGHIDSRGVCINDYPSVAECLVRMPSIEPRALNLFVKEGMEERFESEFKRFFGDDFILMKKQEVIDRKLFGTGEEHPCFRSMLGDYLAVATGDLTVFNTERETEKFKSVHAGLTEAEMIVPLIVIE